ncbi:methyltransferase [Fonsecaea pedrosoi]|nr:methyltransferase [Fonsecaea pedrosoi]
MKHSEIAEPAQSGFAPAAAYDAHRPTYPDEAVQRLLEACEVAGVEGAKIADLAAGTGKFTEILARRPEEYDIVAIEPHDGMRAQLEQKHLAHVRVLKGTADNMPGIANESLACLIASQTAGELTGHNADNSPKSWTIHPGWEQAMRDVIWTFEDGSPRFRHEKWRQVFEDQTASNPLSATFANPLFGLPLGEGSVEFTSWLSKEDIWARLRTLSQLAILEGEELDKVRKAFDDSLRSEGTVIDRDGLIAVHGRTVFFWTKKIPAEPLKSSG